MDLAELWQLPDMWDALARRDIGEVYRLLCAHGLTQHVIAARTRQSQSEVSAIMAGRQVMAYELLERIAKGLGIPRGRLGLAQHPIVVAPAAPRDEPVERARYLAHAAKVTLGRPAFGEPGALSWASERTPVPNRVGQADVDQLNQGTDRFAELERRCGGGIVLDALNGQLRHGYALLTATGGETVRRQLLVAVALLHRRASCAAFDVGLLDAARQHILRALELARKANETELQAWLFYSAGRMQLYHGPPDVALKLFQFGYPAALASGRPRLRALLEINEARAYAALGASQQSRSAMSSAVELFGEDADGPGWLRFFDVAELYGAAGMAWIGLGDEQRAIAALRKSLAARPAATALYRAFDTAELAACHLRNGDIGEGIRVGIAALDEVEPLRSRRARTRLTPLLVAAGRGGAVARSLYERVADVQRS
jgi:transcriptional regulator with XRE-family HTH domain